MENTLLSKINTEADVKALDTEGLKQLAGEIREFLVENVAKTGGHLASNLGVIELTLALHKVFNTPIDKIVWDVGHQAYVHKILTGRKDCFKTLRQAGGLSGFPKASESVHDCFNTGHSSTSISAALGIARARDIKKEQYSVAAVIGDGALTGGMSFEALNDAGRSPNNLIVILNDNEMSISKNVGGLSKYLNKIRTDPFYNKAKEDIDNLLSKLPVIAKGATKAFDKTREAIKYLIVPGLMFEELGFKYIGPIDGHNIDELIKVLSRAKNMKGPILIHVCTVKGKGYTFAEESPLQFHGISSFEVETGEVKKSKGASYSEIFGKHLTKLAEDNKKITAITAAMPDGTGLNYFYDKFADRFFDVGIAEQHAVTLAAGMARNGLVPVVAVYSTFLQRAYDQILHDVALQNLHVVFAIDRAGVVGEDGETHQGLYDLSYLSHIPNMMIMAPSSGEELQSMLEYAVNEHRGPVAIRYPRGNASAANISTRITPGKGEIVTEGSDVSILALGSMLETAQEVQKILKAGEISAEVINARFLKPLDEKLIFESILKTGRLVTIEDNVLLGGMGSSVCTIIASRGMKTDIRCFGFPDEPVMHGSRKSIMKKYGLDARSIADSIFNFVCRQDNMVRDRYMVGGTVGKGKA